MARVRFLKLGQVVRVKGCDELFIIEGTSYPERIKPLFKPVRYHVVGENEAEYVFPSDGPQSAAKIERAAKYLLSDFDTWTPADHLILVRGPRAWWKRLKHWWKYTMANDEWDEDREE